MSLGKGVPLPWTTEQQNQPRGQADQPGGQAGQPGRQAEQGQAAALPAGRDRGAEAGDTEEEVR